MNSSTNRKQTAEEKQASIRRQIALLQAQLEDVPDVSNQSGPSTPKKRKRESQTVLAPATPSPKKKKVIKDHRAYVPKQSTASSGSVSSKPYMSGSAPVRNPTTSATRTCNGALPPEERPASSVLSKLATFASASSDEPKKAASRSSNFREVAAPPPIESPTALPPSTRDNDLAVIEDLELGPYDHKAPFDDPHFEKIEPNSGIRLSSRAISYDDFQDYLRGRYYLSPSRLYSVVRLLPSKQGYDVPVEGDWVTIAVVAERGPLRYTKAPVGIGKDDKDVTSDAEDDVKTLTLEQPLKPTNAYHHNMKPRANKGKEAEPQKPSGKKYINLKLIDFGCRTRSSASGGRAAIRGDAFLSLLLFEADRVDLVERDDGAKEKVYKGGSRGAFEKLSKLKEGSVVAFLNPRILKPFQRSGDTPHPVDNILAITPESADAIAVIGQSQDLGMCSAIKRDGKRCGSWCDKRASDVCEYHIQHAVQGKRAGRAEFSIGTSGMTSAAKRKPEYDPTRQWGLKPDPDRSEGTGATYVVSGHVVSGNASSLFVSESLGRDAQAKAARKVAAKDADRALQNLLRRDREGTRAVKAARDFGKKLESKSKNEKASSIQQDSKGKERARAHHSDSDEEDEEEKSSKNAYSATLIKSIGFDPTGKDGRRTKDVDIERKLRMLATSRAARKDIELGPRPGKLKTTVRAPAHAPAEGNIPGDGPNQQSPSPGNRSESPALLMPESEDEAGDVLPVSADIGGIGKGAGGKAVRPNAVPGEDGPAGMVDLDSSDVDI